MKTLLGTIILGWWTTLHPQDPACEVSKPSFLSLPKRCVWIPLADRVRIPSDPWKKYEKVANDGTWVSQILQTFGICIVSSWNLRHVETSHHPEIDFRHHHVMELIVYVWVFRFPLHQRGFLRLWVLNSLDCRNQCWSWSWSVEMDDCMLLRSRIIIGCTTLRLSVETI